VAYTKQELERAIRLADEQGDTESLKVLASEWERLAQTQQTVVQPISDAVDTETNNYFADQARMGVVDLMESAVGILGEQWRELFFPSQEEPKGEWGSRELYIPANSEEYYAEREASRARREQSKQEVAKDLLGYSGAQVGEDDWLSRLGGIAVREAVADPIGTFAGGKGKLGLLQELIASTVSVSAGAVSSETVRAWGEELGFSPQAIELVQGITNIVAGSGSGMLAQGAMRGVNRGVNALQQNKKIIEQVDGAAELMANSQVKSAVRSAIKAQPDIDSAINAARVLEDKVPGLVLPSAVVLKNNPVLAKNLESLAMVSPGLRAKLTESLRDLDNAVTKRKTALFGDTSPSKAEQALSSRAAQVDINISNILRRVRGIDANIQKTIEPLRSTETADTIGARVRGLIEAKEKALSSAASQKYNHVIDKYSQQGLRFPAQSVANIYKTATSMRYKNLFADHPRVVNLISSMYKPKKPKQPPKIRSLSLEQLDSLKRAINEGIRNESSGGKRAELNRLKDVLKAEIDKMGSFGQEYQGVDNWYREQVGIPLNQAGIRELSAAKFAEVVGTRLKRPETAREFLSFAGKDGVNVLKDSIILRLGDSVINKVDDTLDVNKFISFARANQQVIDLVPGLREQLRDIGGTLQVLEDTKSRLDTQYTAHAKRLTDNVFSTVYNKGLNSTIFSILNSPSKSADLFRSVSNYTADTAAIAKQGVRVGLLDAAMRSSSPMQFMEKNANVYRQWFGDRYLNNIKSLGEVIEMAAKLDLEKIPYAHTVKDQDIVQEYTGNTIPNITAQIRNRIISLPQKLAILGSRFFNKKTTESRDAAMEELFLDTRKLQTIADLAKAKRENKITVAKFTEGLWNLLNFSTTKSYLRAEAGVDAMEQDRARYYEEEAKLPKAEDVQISSVIPTPEQLMQLNPILQRQATAAQ